MTYLTGVTSRLFKGLFLISRSLGFLIFVRSEKDGPEEAAIHSGSVHDDRVFLVVTSVAENRYYRVDAGREFSEAQILHGTGGDERLLRIAQDVCQRVHSNVEVRDVDTHGLFTHSALIGVTRRLVVIREWNN